MKGLLKKCYNIIKKGVEYIMGKVNEIAEIKKEADIRKFECIEHCVDVTIELVKGTVIGTVTLIKEHPIVLIAIGGAILVENYINDKKEV